tara:strand:- start:746 stop:1069 length:324 start_codon:yes stop_codon:yes gene_type:complete
MKNIFETTEEEKNRIRGLHTIIEQEIKKDIGEREQYLNEKGLKIDKGEGRMAKHDTMELMNDAKEVSEMIQDDMDLPEWVESKITIAAENLNTVRDYISHHILGTHK